MPKRIYFFTLDITLVGGIERVVSNLANDLSKHHDFEVIIVSFFKKNSTVFYTINNNVSILYLNDNAFKIDTFKNKLRSHYSILINTIKFLNKQNEKLTVISTLANISIYLGLFIHKKNVIKIAAEHSQYYGHGFIVRSIRLFAYRFINKVVTLTTFDKAIFQKMLGQNKAINIPNSLSFYPTETALQTSNTIITVGRLVPDKGFDILIDAFAKVVLQRQDWKLTIIGGGELQDVLNEQIRTLNLSNFVLIKPATKNIKEELLNASIYVCSSRTEAFPMALMEAMACGLAIVSFDCPVGPREILQDQIDGILVDNGSDEKLAQAILNLINNSGKIKQLANNAKQNVKQYLPETVHPCWIKLIEDLQ